MLFIMYPAKLAPAPDLLDAAMEAYKEMRKSLDNLVTTALNPNTFTGKIASVKNDIKSITAYVESSGLSAETKKEANGLLLLITKAIASNNYADAKKECVELNLLAISEELEVFFPLMTVENSEKGIKWLKKESAEIGYLAAYFDATADKDFLAEMAAAKANLDNKVDLIETYLGMQTSDWKTNNKDYHLENITEKSISALAGQKPKIGLEASLLPKNAFIAQDNATAAVNIKAQDIVTKNVAAEIEKDQQPQISSLGTAVDKEIAKTIATATVEFPEDVKKAADDLVELFKGYSELEWAKTQLAVIKDYADKNNLTAISSLAAVIENECVPLLPLTSEYPDLRELLKILDLLVLLTDKGRDGNLTKIGLLLGGLQQNDPFRTVQLALIDPSLSGSGLAANLDQLQLNTVSYANLIAEIKETMRGISVADGYSNYNLHADDGSEVYKPGLAAIPDDIAKCATYYFESIIKGCEFSIKNTKNSDVSALYTSLKETAEEALAKIKGAGTTQSDKYSVVSTLIDFKTIYTEAVTQAQTEEYWDERYAEATGPFSKCLVYFERNAGTIQLMSAITLSVLYPPLGKAAFMYMGAESVVEGAENEDVKQVLFGIAMMTGYAKNPYVSALSQSYINASIAVDTWNMIKLADETAFTSTTIENIGINTLFLCAYAKSVRDMNKGTEGQLLYVPEKTGIGKDATAKSKITVGKETVSETGTGMKPEVKEETKKQKPGLFIMPITFGEKGAKITDAAISSLEMNLHKPLFNLSDPKTKSIYETLLNKTQANAISRDITSWTEITSAVQTHLDKNGNGALIIIEGASTHIWGAVPKLEKFGCRYIEAPLLSLDAQSKSMGKKIGIEGITVQLKRDIGVVKYLGFNNIEDFIGARRKLQNPFNVIVSFEETGYHEIYASKDDSPQYNILKKYLLDYKPTSVLFIGEDLFVDNFRKDINEYRATGHMDNSDMPRNRFIMAAIDQKITVELGAFGWADRKSGIGFPSYGGLDFTYSHLPEIGIDMSEVIKEEKTEKVTDKKLEIQDITAKQGTELSTETSNKIETLMDLPAPLGKLSLDYLKTNGLAEANSGVILGKGNETAKTVFLEVSKLSPDAAQSYLKLVGRVDKIPVLTLSDAMRMKGMTELPKIELVSGNGVKNFMGSYSYIEKIGTATGKIIENAEITQKPVVLGMVLRGGYPLTRTSQFVLSGLKESKIVSKVISLSSPSGLSLKADRLALEGVAKEYSAKGGATVVFFDEMVSGSSIVKLHSTAELITRKYPSINFEIYGFADGSAALKNAKTAMGADAFLGLFDKGVLKFESPVLQKYAESGQANDFLSNSKNLRYQMDMDFTKLYENGFFSAKNVAHAQKVAALIKYSGARIKTSVEFMPNLFTLDNNLLLYDKIGGKYNAGSFDLQKFQRQQDIMSFFSLIWRPGL